MYDELKTRFSAASSAAAAAAGRKPGNAERGLKDKDSDKMLTGSRRRELQAVRLCSFPVKGELSSASSGTCLRLAGRGLDFWMCAPCAWVTGALWHGRRALELYALPPGSPVAL